MLAVLMLQVIAMGFCVSGSQAHAADMQPIAATHNHCGMVSMSMSAMPMSAVQPVDQPPAACVHCDLPDVSLSLDQQQDLHLADMVLVMMWAIALMPAPSCTPALANPSPPFLHTLPSLFDLNPRVRV